MCELKKRERFPLVSVCIITYNSSSFILETLDSIKKQSYKSLELIVSDDASTDNTVEVVNKWFKENSSRFVSSRIVTVEKNTGVSANCNRVVKAAKGEWIKLLAGDDLLPNDSIEKYYNYAANTDCNICFAKMKMFGEDKNELIKVDSVFEKNYYPCLKMDHKHQKREILKRLFVPGPGLFYRKTLWENCNYNEEYPFCEEYPFAYDVLSKGNRIHFIDDYLVLYRVRKSSLCRSELGMSLIVFQDYRRYFIDHRRSNMLQNGLILRAWDQTISLFYQSIQYKYGIYSLHGKVAKCLALLSPFTYIRFLRKIARYSLSDFCT